MDNGKDRKMGDKEKISKAIELGLIYGFIDGSHHKMWTIDKMLRILLDKDYEKTIKENNKREWDIGIAP